MQWVHNSTSPSAKLQILASKAIKFFTDGQFFTTSHTFIGMCALCMQVIRVDHSAIILPALALEQFYEALGQFVDMVKSQGLIRPSATNVWTIAPPWKISKQFLSSKAT
jgi:hypothetical protein